MDVALDAHDLELIRDVVIEGVEAGTSLRFDVIEAWLNDHDKRFDEIDKRFDEVSERLVTHDG